MARSRAYAETRLPFALGFAETVAALWNALIVGVLVLTFAAVDLGRISRTHDRIQDQS